MLGKGGCACDCCNAAAAPPTPTHTHPSPNPHPTPSAGQLPHHPQRRRHGQPHLPQEAERGVEAGEGGRLEQEARCRLGLRCAGPERGLLAHRPAHTDHCRGSRVLTRARMGQRSTWPLGKHRQVGSQPRGAPAERGGQQWAASWGCLPVHALRTLPDEDRPGGAAACRPRSSCARCWPQPPAARASRRSSGAAGAGRERCVQRGHGGVRNVCGHRWALACSCVGQRGRSGPQRVIPQGPLPPAAVRQGT